MRTGILFALSGAAMLAFASVSNAAPLAVTGAPAVAIDNAIAGEGFTEVQHRRHWHHHHSRHHRWHRHHRHGWRHHHHPRTYGYAPRHRHRSGVHIHIR